MPPYNLKEAQHNSEFWRRLERTMPDFGMRKEWLAANGATTTAI
ncbi:MAG: hypothetical protein ACYDA0_13475 [Candidatus Dormibacteraceae bacterium]